MDMLVYSETDEANAKRRKQLKLEPVSRVIIKNILR